MTLRYYPNPFYHERTLADELRDNPKPHDPRPHAHFHTHGGSLHSHDSGHPHPDDWHAHSTRTDLPAHRGNDAD